MCFESYKFSFYKYIPARFVLVFLGFFAFALAYAYKVMLSVTIVSMAKPLNQTDHQGQCFYDNSTSNWIENEDGEFLWDSHQQALVLGAFFYGYFLIQLPAGILSEKYGAKWIFGCFLVATAVLSLLGPIAARTHLALFFIVRFAQGLTEGVVFPCMNVLFARWLPKMERGLMSSITFTGAQIGTVVTFPLSGFLCDGEFMGGWPAVFYVLGIAGCIWFVLWALLIHETPKSHPYISKEELQHIINGQKNEQTSQKPPIPWKSILTSVPVYALILTHYGQNWSYLTILTMLPTYFERILHIDIKQNGLLSSLPYLFQAIVSIIISYFADRIRKSGKVPVNVIRKVCNTIAFMGPAVCLIGVTFSGCNSFLSAVFFTISMGLNGFHYSGYMLNHVDMAPDFAGTLMGITNGISNMNGFISPLVTAAITHNNQTIEGWSIVFYISSFIYFVSALIYIFFSTANLQSWGIHRKLINN